MSSMHLVVLDGAQLQIVSVAVLLTYCFLGLAFH